MNTRRMTIGLFVFLSLAFLVGCLGEPSFPELENMPFPTRVPPLVNPTVAAAPRISLLLDGQTLSSNQTNPQIPHDLIGRSDCLMCHKQGVSDAPRIPDTHFGLESNTCQTCHTAPTDADMSGAELYVRVCARCHGDLGEGGVGPALNTKTYLGSVSDDEIKTAIIRGRGTEEMLAWGDLGLLTERQIIELVSEIRSWEATAPEYASSIAAEPINATQGDPVQGETLFSQFCSGCHGLYGETALDNGFILRESILHSDDALIANSIRDGGAGMPSFHALLTTNDLNDLLALMRTWHEDLQPTPTLIVISGEEIFSRVCARCHGKNGEGNTGPALNSKGFLTTNDDESISQWIERGTLGTSMLSWGDLGLLTRDQIAELVSFIRAWEPTAQEAFAGPPPPPSSETGNSVHGRQLFAQFCSGCHGLEGERLTRGISLNSEDFLGEFNDEIIASQIQNGGKEMPSFHAVLTRSDVNDLLALIRDRFNIEEPPASVPSFTSDILPILGENCSLCHGTSGGWSADSYESVMTSGDNSPVLLIKDPDNSILIQKLQNTQTYGMQMPPSQILSSENIKVFIDWILAGAPDN